MRLRTIYRITVPALVGFTVVNVVLCAIVLNKMRSPLEYNLQIVESPRIEVPVASTNQTVELRRGIIGDNSPRPVASHESMPVERWQHSYHFCVVNGKPVAVLNGVRCRVGDVHAYGRISAIYPERIYFTDGSFIQNERNANYADGTGVATVL